MVRELSLSWGHFPITLSLAEGRINLTITVWTSQSPSQWAGGDLGMGEGTFPAPIQLPWPHGQLPFAQHPPEQGQAAAQTSYWRRRLG